MNISELNFVNMQDVYRTCKEWLFSYSLNDNEQQRETAESIKSKCNLLSKSKIKPRLRREINGSRKKSVSAYRGIK